MKKIASLLLAASLLVTAGWMNSCSKPEPDHVTPDQPEQPDQPEKPDFDPNAKITFTQEPKYNFSGEGGSLNVVFTCTGYWELEIPKDMDWISASVLSGKGSTNRQSFKLTAVANPDESARKGTLVLRAGENNTKNISVTQDESVLILSEKDVPNLDKIYIPLEFRSFDMFRSDSKWSFCRSRQSEHFIVFWDIKYGSHGTTTPTECKSRAGKTLMKVDIDDLLARAEEFYDLNVNKLKFADTGKGLSVLDKYKMEIFIIWQEEWLATGSGYDNTIGALWVNPSTCQPVGSTIGHEIGHCFQYMTFCDYLVREGKGGDKAPNANTNEGPGWRYGFGPNGSGGNAFWEQTAQWQSMQIEKYRPEAFSGWYGEFTSSTHLHVLHERPRYANYFIHWWWVEENDKDITFIGRMWNEAQYPEDPVETYMRMTGKDVDAMNDSMWGYAAHMLTYDTDEIRKYGTGSIGKTALAASFLKRQDDWWAVASTRAPESTGSNAIRMTLPSSDASSRDVTATLASNLGLDGCISGSAAIAGWRYGFVSYNKDGSTSYSPVWSALEESQTWTVPDNVEKLWFVVTAAPSEYERHPWIDESDDKDTKWPWKARFEGIKPWGK